MSKRPTKSQAVESAEGGIERAVVNEVTWIKNCLVPTLRRLGFVRVVCTHGQNEAGKDVVFATYDRFGLPQYYAAQVKYGNLRQSSKDAQLSTIIGQLKTAYEVPYRDEATGRTHRILGVYLIISGSMTESARGILHSHTEKWNWLSIVDESQLDIATRLATSITDATWRLLLTRTLGETKHNAEKIEFIDQQARLDNPDVRIMLLCGLIKAQSAATLREMAWQDLNEHDVSEIDRYLRSIDSMNILLQALPYTEDTADALAKITSIKLLKLCHTIRGQLRIISDASKRVTHLIEALIVTERPEPGNQLPRLGLPNPQLGEASSSESASS